MCLPGKVPGIPFPQVPFSVLLLRVGRILTSPRNTFKSACQRKERKEDGENKNNDDNAPRPLRF